MSTRSVLAAAALVGGLAPTLAAVPTEAAASPSRSGPGWVTGVVTDADGHPLAGRLVNVLDVHTVPEGGLVPDVTDRRTYTDVQGRFHVRQAAGGYLVQICHPEEDRPSCKKTVRGVDHVITYVGGTGVTDSWVTQTRLFDPTAASATSARSRSGRRPRCTADRGRAATGPSRSSDSTGRSPGTAGPTRRRLRFDGMAPGRYRSPPGATARPALALGTGRARRLRAPVVDGELDEEVGIQGRLSPRRPVTRVDSG